ncbi:hypothetical protein LCGC14_0432830 [marine sediment metagenome]|uniref:Uncharacterized protein n=1 Tax=marine sediment metagenome TaxID=412755 RepID=A0A0F9VX02_9ZZZZ
MSYTEIKFAQTSAGANSDGNVIREWSYKDTVTDVLATITASGFFNTKIKLLAVGDIMKLIGTDDEMTAKVTSVTTNVTVTEYVVAVVADGSITNAKVNATAGIVPSKFAVTSGNIIVGVGGAGVLLDAKTDGAVMVGNGVALVSTVMSGDATITESAVVSISPDVIINADIKSDAAIVLSKLALVEGSIMIGSAGGVGVALDAKTDTGIMIGNGTTATVAVMSGDATMANTGVVTLAVPKIRVAKLHTWAGGAATTDTVTLTGVAATDVILVTGNAIAGAASYCVTAVRSGADLVLVTMSAALANADILSVTAIQVV